MIGSPVCLSFFFFFFNDTATTEIYTLSLHDALPISFGPLSGLADITQGRPGTEFPSVFNSPFAVSTSNVLAPGEEDRKSTRLNSSHLVISYAVFCLKKKTQTLYVLEQHISPSFGRVG